jgi:hypothetical protein
MDMDMDMARTRASGRGSETATGVIADHACSAIFPVPGFEGPKRRCR